MDVSPLKSIAAERSGAAERPASDAARPADRADAGAFASALHRAGKPERSAGKTPEAFVKFEAMVLQSFLQSLLPKDTETVYGGGLPGEMWKSLMAEKIGEVMAERGGIGIADRVLGDHYLEGERKVPVSGVSQGADRQEADQQTALSMALVEEMQRNFVKAIGEDQSAAAAHAEGRK